MKLVAIWYQSKIKLKKYGISDRGRKGIKNIIPCKK